LRILLDDGLPRPFERLLIGHETVHCSRLGWERFKNGNLLSAADDAGFPVMVTVDQSIQHQQNMSGRRVAVIYLRAAKNDLATLAPMAAMVMGQLQNLQPGSIVTIERPDWR
jgi:hypothetical protein